jgi:hypothetical protein
MRAAGVLRHVALLLLVEAQRLTLGQHCPGTCRPSLQQQRRRMQQQQQQQQQGWCLKGRLH